MLESQRLRVEPSVIGWKFFGSHSLLLLQRSAFEAPEVVCNSVEVDLSENVIARDRFVAFQFCRKVLRVMLDFRATETQVSHIEQA